MIFRDTGHLPVAARRVARTPNPTHRLEPRMTDTYDPQHGDHVRITCTGPTGESIYEGVVHRQAEDLSGFELKGHWITGGKEIHLWFAVDRAAHPNSAPGFAQTISLITPGGAAA